MSQPAVVAVGRANAALCAWRREGELYATIASKVTFSFAGGNLSLTDPAPLTATEIHHKQNPMRSIREAADLVPFKHHAELLFVGSAFCAPAAAMETTARIALHRGGQPLVDKTLRVVGDRADATAKPAAFPSMPLVYERSAGGMGKRENPLGSEVPNILNTEKGRPAPAGFAPISWTWAARKAALPEGRKPLELPVAELPNDLGDYFQAAPSDQRFDKLSGGETLTLEGVLPDRPRLVLGLPIGTALAHVLAPAERGRDVVMYADTLFIDGEAQTLSLVFRVIEPFSTIELLQATRFAAGVTFGGQPMVWPDLSAAKAASLGSTGTMQVSTSGTFILGDAPGTEPLAPQAEQPDRGHSGTLVLEDNAVRARSLPFPKEGAPRGAPPAKQSTPGAPWSGDTSEVQPADHALGSTVTIDEPAPPQAAAPSPPQPAPLPAPKVVPTKAAKWRAPDPEPAAAPPPAKAPSQLDARQPAPPVKKSIYGKFGK